MAGQLIRPSPLVTVPVLVPLVTTVRVNLGVKVAVTFTAELAMVNEQVPVPLQAPLQPENTKPEAGVAVRVTALPELKLAEQLAVQLMPAGLLTTVPEPLKVRFTGKGVRVKLAATDCAALMVTVQVPVPAQPAPLQPAKVDPAAATAFRVTEVPCR